VFFGFLVPLAGAAHLLVIHNGMTLPLVAYAMWTPAMASILTRLIRGEGFSDVSFDFRTPRMGTTLGVAFFYPLTVGLLAYGGAWAVGLADFSWKTPAFLGALLHGIAPPIGFAIWVLIVPLITFPLSASLALGEELGWRGFMVKRLIEAELPCPVLLSGLVWGVYHVPIILSGQYGPAGSSGWTAVGPFMVGIVAAAYTFAAVRLVSGSVWPAVVLHAVYNSVMQDGFDRAFHGAGGWLGEAGLLTVAVEVLLATGVWLWYRKIYRKGAFLDVAWGDRPLC